eukprot:1194270-Prorocentrum_minimum.AAC.2
MKRLHAVVSDWRGHQLGWSKRQNPDITCTGSSPGSSSASGCTTSASGMADEFRSSPVAGICVCAVEGLPSARCAAQYIRYGAHRWDVRAVKRACLEYQFFLTWSNGRPGNLVGVDARATALSRRRRWIVACPHRLGSSLQQDIGKRSKPLCHSPVSVPKFAQ